MTTPSATRLVHVVDPDARRRQDIGTVLAPFYQVRYFGDGAVALTAARTAAPVAVLIHEGVGPRGCLHAVHALRRERATADAAIVCTTRADHAGFRRDAIACGADAVLAAPYTRADLLSVVSGRINGRVERGWHALDPVPRSALTETLGAFNAFSDRVMAGGDVPYAAVRESCAPLVEAINTAGFKDVLSGVRRHDNYSFVHSLRVATFLGLLGKAAGLRGDELVDLVGGGLVHDAGKMAVPSHILNKPGKLTDAEFAIMKTHVAGTVASLENTGVPRAVRVIAAQHHERLDGTGYPNGLGGRELNALARMAAIVDVFGALTDERIYKPAIAPEKALSLMTEDMAGHHLDPSLLALFRETLLDSASRLEDDRTPHHPDDAAPANAPSI